MKHIALALLGILALSTSIACAEVTIDDTLKQNFSYQGNAIAPAAGTFLSIETQATKQPTESAIGPVAKQCIVANKSSVVCRN